jgi:hypothetical protein
LFTELLRCFVTRMSVTYLFQTSVNTHMGAKPVFTTITADDTMTFEEYAPGAPSLFLSLAPSPLLSLSLSLYPSLLRFCSVALALSSSHPLSVFVRLMANHVSVVQCSLSKELQAVLVLEITTHQVRLKYFCSHSPADCAFCVNNRVTFRSSVLLSSSWQCMSERDAAIELFRLVDGKILYASAVVFQSLYSNWESCVLLSSSLH